MSAFTPKGRFMVGRVPFDATYRHTRGPFPSKDAQRAYFASKMAYYVDDGEYTYIRQNQSVRVDSNAEDMYTYNYCMYQNANYGDKWFYAFIVDVRYVNENCTELVLEQDVVQTWWFDALMGQCTIDRAMPVNDAIGANIIPEPDMPFVCVSQERFSDGDLVDDVNIIIQTNAWPISSNNPLMDIDVVSDILEGAGIASATATASRSGGMVHNIFSGCSYLVFPTEIEDQGRPHRSEKASNFLIALNTAGGGDSVTGVFMFPKKFTPSTHKIENEIVGVEEVDTGTKPVSTHHVVHRPTHLDGYIPYNNKLFTYPYCFCQFDDNNGHVAQYRYEFWEPIGESDEGEVGREYSVTMGLDPAATVFIIPQDYDGIQSNVTEAFTFPYETNCSWPYSAYKNWVAQNSFANMVGAASAIAGFAFPALRGASYAAKALGMGMKANKAVRGLTSLDAMGRINTGLAYERAAGYAAMGRQYAARAGVMGGLAAPSAMQGLNLAADIDRMSKVPDVAKASTSGNGIYTQGFMTYNHTQMVIRHEFARVIDMFFQEFGYQLDVVGQPKTYASTRQNWNYVKTSNCVVYGTLPGDAASALESILDNGITFWHDDEVAVYNRRNPSA